MNGPLTQPDPIWDDPQLLKKKRTVGIISLVVVFLVLLALTILLGKPVIRAIREKESFRTWMQGTGFWKYPLMVGIMALQVIIAFIPGEPIEIIAGYIFGGWGGLVLCLLGCALGSVVIILAVRKLGIRFVRLFVSQEQIENLKLFRDPKKRDATIFLLFLIPGTPKDILTYLSGLVPIHLGKYLLLTSIARIPSIITSTMGGSMLGLKKYGWAILIFGITMVVTLILTLLYRAYQKRKTALQAALALETEHHPEEGQQQLHVPEAPAKTEAAAEEAPAPPQQTGDTPPALKKGKHVPAQ